MSVVNVIASLVPVKMFQYLHVSPNFTEQTVDKIVLYDMYTSTHIGTINL